MGTELAKTDKVLLKEYEAAVGSSKGLGMPRLFFNRNATDKNGEIILDSEGDPLGMGSYNISTMEGHFKEVRFTITHVTYSYVRSEEQKDTGRWKVLSSSILFTDWKADHISSDGKLRAGRVTKAVLDDMDDEDKKKEKMRVPCFLHLFGLVTVEDEEGNEVSTPVELRIRGGNFFTMTKVLNEIKDYAKYELTLGADVNKENKANIFGFITATASTTKVAVTKELVETAVGFGKYIENYNDMIRNQYKKAMRGEDFEAEAEELVGEVVEGDFEEVTDEDDGVTAEDVFVEEEEEAPKKKPAVKKKKATPKKKKAEVVEEDDDDLNDEIPF